MALLAGGVDIQLPLLASLDTQDGGAPHYCWAEVGILLPTRLPLIPGWEE